MRDNQINLSNGDQKSIGMRMNTNNTLIYRNDLSRRHSNHRGINITSQYEDEDESNVYSDD